MSSVKKYIYIYIMYIYIYIYAQLKKIDKKYV